MSPRYLIRLSAVLLAAAIPLDSPGGQTPLVSGRGEGAPPGIEQYGQFVGQWSCAPAFRDPEGNWQEADARPTWAWHYVLNGRAIQDVWIPDPDYARPNAAMGTNLRVYDARTDTWEMVWTTETMGGFQHFTAKMKDGDIVMRGDLPAGQRPAHLARITFHGITADHFDWKYEASAPDDGKNWQVYSTLSCDRK